MGGFEVAVGVFEVDVVDDGERRDAGVEDGVAVGREEEVNLVLVEDVPDAALEEQVPQDRVTCLWTEGERGDVFGKEELRVGGAVE